MRFNGGVEVPAGWGVVPLKRVARFGYGEALASDDRDSGQFKVYGSNGPFDNHSAANTLAPCIIVGRKGSYGKIQFSEEPVFAVDTTFVVDRRHTAADLRFLYYLLGILGLDELSDDTAVPGLSREKAYQSLAPLPPLETQRRIARFLDEKTARIDGLIEKKRALLDRLAEKRQALITRAVTKGLNPDAPMKPSGIDWLGDIPAHWETKKLRYTVMNLNNMRVPIAAELRKGVERTYPYYGASGIIDYVDEYIFDFSTVLVAEDGANLLSRSTPLAFSADGKYWVNNHAHILKPVALTIWFCESILAMYPLDPYISGSAQPKLTKDSLSGLPVWVPPMEEQRQIEKETASLAAALKKAEIPLRGSLAKLEEYRAAFITAAVTGGINGD